MIRGAHPDRQARERELIFTPTGMHAGHGSVGQGSRECRAATGECRYTLGLRADAYRDAVLEDVDLDQSRVKQTAALQRPRADAARLRAGWLS